MQNDERNGATERRTPSEGRPRHSRDIVRFGGTERVFHWAFALPFLGLLLSGLPLRFPGLRSWIDGYSPEIGMRLHLACGIAWLLAPCLVVLLGHRKALAATAAELFAIARDEYTWLRQLPRWLLGAPCRMERVGKFNAGQKLNAWLVAVTSVLLALTGIVLWAGWQWPGSASTEVLLVTRLVAWSRYLHFVLTLLILVPLLGHILLATVHPRTRASFRGMVFGVVDADWARRHHPAWYVELYPREVGAEGPAEPRPAAPDGEGS